LLDNSQRDKGGDEKFYYDSVLSKASSVLRINFLEVSGSFSIADNRFISLRLDGVIEEPEKRVTYTYTYYD